MSDLLAPVRERFLDGDLYVFRIAHRRHPTFDGMGALLKGGRWTSPGRRVINAATAYSSSLLENLVHWAGDRVPAGMRYAVARIPADLGREQVDTDDVPGWNRLDSEGARKRGDTWFDAGLYPVLIVPSVVTPFEPNVLINQDHPDFSRIEKLAEGDAVLDARLFKEHRP